MVGLCCFIHQNFAPGVDSKTSWSFYLETVIIKLLLQTPRSEDTDAMGKVSSNVFGIAGSNALYVEPDGFVCKMSLDVTEPELSYSGVE